MNGRRNEAGPDGESTDLAQALGRLHKSAFGGSVGLTVALLLLVLTAVHAVRQPGDPYPLSLLENFLYGYSVSLRGAIAGAFWAGFAGFVAGWFLAFSRNFLIAVFVFVIRVRAELEQTQDFLDHI